jgi:3-deoxy-manno-octulosonate cytidylyltransferase (CMP-KDO synthetase)
MIERVYRQAEKSKLLSDIIVATDHDDIKSEVESFGGKIIMTSSACKNGTERCAEVISTLNINYDIIINIQGDEPFFEPKSLDIVVACFDEKVEIATLVKKIERTEEVYEPTVVKVVFNQDYEALYFSRAAIPFNRENSSIEYYKHIGIYAFSSRALKEIVKHSPTALEITEQLEQLRWLENGWKIKLGFTQHDSNSVDTPEDLEKLKLQFRVE